MSAVNRTDHPLPAGTRVDADELIGLRGRAAALDLSPGRRAAAVAGTRESRYRGRGMEYEESRAYQPGDDIRHMDWRVTARTGRPHTKVYRAERDRPVLAVVDLGPQMRFGTRRAFKSVVAATAAAAIGWSAIGRGDRFGALLHAGDNHCELRPQGGRRAVLGVIRELEAWLASDPLIEGPVEEGVEVDPPLARARRVARPGSLVFVLSDFYAMERQLERHVWGLARHADVVACPISDPIERHAPRPGRYPVTDGVRAGWLNFHGRQALERYHAATRDRLTSVTARLRRLSISVIPLTTDGDPLQELSAGLRGSARHPRAKANPDGSSESASA